MKIPRELREWVRAADQEVPADSAERVNQPLTTREKFMNAVLAFANKPLSDATPIEFFDGDLPESLIRWGVHPLTEDRELHSRAFYVDGIPPKYPLAPHPIEEMTPQLTFTNDHKSEQQQGVYPVVYELCVVERLKGDVIHAVTLHADTGSVGMDFGDEGDWFLTPEDSTQTEIDAMLIFFMIRHGIDYEIESLQAAEKGTDELIIPTVQELVRRAFIETHRSLEQKLF